MFFYILGWLGLIIGGAWAGLSLAAAGAAMSAAGNRSADGLAALAGLFVAAPGFNLMGGSLLLLAIGAGLSRLDTLIALARQNLPQETYRGDTSRWSKRDRDRLSDQEPQF